MEEVLLVIVLGLFFFISNLLVGFSSLLEFLFVTIPLLRTVHLISVVEPFPEALSYLPILAMFFLLNKLVSGPSVTTRVSVIAATISTVIWLFTVKVFSCDVNAFHSYSMLYGACAFVFAFFVWVHSTSFVLTTGATMGQLYRERTMKR